VDCWRTSTISYIGNNPARKQYQDYPHVHTKYLDRTDPISNHLLPWSDRPSYAVPYLSLWQLPSLLLLGTPSLQAWLSNLATKPGF
jgi:hypothetical protein